MESSRQGSAMKCASAGCRHAALSADELCLFHSQIKHRGRSDHSRNILRNAEFRLSHDLPNLPGSPRSGEQSKAGQLNLCRNNSTTVANSSTSPHQTIWSTKTNLPPDLLSKHGKTARKSISSLNPSKGRVDGRTETASLGLGNPIKTTNHGKTVAHRSKVQSPGPSSDAADATSCASQGRQTSRLTSPPSSRPGQASNSATNGACLAVGIAKDSQSLHRAAVSDPESEQVITSAAGSMSQASIASQNATTGRSVSRSTRFAHDPSALSDIDHPRNKPKEMAKVAMSPTATFGEKDFRSLPYVRTGHRPPLQIKSAPTISQSASKLGASASPGKRKRGSSSDSTSCYSSESDEEVSSSLSPSLTVGQAATSRPTESSLVSHEGTGGTGGTAASSTAYFEAGRKSASLFNSIEDSSTHSMPAANIQNVRQKSFTDLNELSSRASVSTALGFSFEGVNEDLAGGTELRAVGDRNSITIPAINGFEPLLPDPGDLGRETPPMPRKKMSCEERRQQLCTTFDADKFDAMIYGQEAAGSPPLSVYLPAVPALLSAASVPAEEPHHQFYMKLDPRIHWPHNRSEEWYKRKMEEIKARGGRKANFGKAPQRMRRQRLAEEQQAAVRAEEAAAAARQGMAPRPHNPLQPWSHNRHMDFGDVPEQELPGHVRKNPAWLRATAWMRENREKNMQRNEEAAALQAAGESWKHLFPRNSR